MKFSQLISSRRSCRTFGSGEIPAEQVQAILRAALLAPSSMNRQSWHFVVVDDKTDLAKLADSKERGAYFVKDAAFAVVVVGQQKDSDCWVEDGYPKRWACSASLLLETNNKPFPLIQTMTWHGRRFM